MTTTHKFPLQVQYEEGADMNCSTPSSGFYSEVGGGGSTERGGRAEFDHLYISPEQVRSKKHVKVGSD